MLHPLLSPASIAVVGVSQDPTKVGHQIFVNLHSYTGQLYPIHPEHAEILGKKAYPSVLDVPAHLDLVIIATPVDTVEGIVDQCIDKKVKAICVITAGFAENSQHGKKTQERIAKKLSSAEILLLGPNTLGVTHPWANMNATFAKSPIQKGKIALISQSGALLTTLFEELASRDRGCSFALSLGNGAGVNATDALAYAGNDAHTTSIAIYLESLPENLPKFFELTKTISQTKPIILLKGGVSEEGRKASLSHTAALATDSSLLAAASAQMGFVLVTTVEQFIESMLAIDLLEERTKRFPKTTMILTNAGGPGVNTVDLAGSYGVDLATWSPQTVKRFSAHLPRVKAANPTDLLGDARTEDIEHALVFAKEDPNIESILLIITPQSVTDVPGITDMIIHHEQTDVLFAHEHYKPLIVAIMGGQGYRKQLLALRQAGIPAVEYANEALEIFGILHQIRRIQSQHVLHDTTNTARLAGTRRTFPVQRGELAEALLLLEAYGFTLPRAAIVSQKSQLDELAELDQTAVFPLIAKTANMRLKHKAILGGVIAGITSVDQAKDAYEKLKKFGDQVLFQEVIPNALEIILGAKRDPLFGPFLAIGAGGSMTNIISDRQYIFLPADRHRMVEAFSSTMIAKGCTKEQSRLVIHAIEHFAQLLMEHPEIEEIELNPILVTDHTLYAVDVKIQMVQ